MKRRRVIIAALVVLVFVSLGVFLPLKRSSPKMVLSIRIAGVATNFSPTRTAVAWEAAVTKPRRQGAAVVWWPFYLEKTNKTSVSHSSIELSVDEGALMSTPLSQNEEGILQWGENETLDSNKVYRVVGAYLEPNALDALTAWGRRLPMLGTLVPASKPTYATSEWYEVVGKIKPTAIVGD